LSEVLCSLYDSLWNKILDKPDNSLANVLQRLADTPRGIIDPVGAAQRIRLATLPPATVALACFVDYYWVVQWNLGGRPPEIQRVLPYPNAHLVFDLGRTAIHGPVTGAFKRTVEGAGRVFGVRFKPGGLRPFIGMPLNKLRDTTMPVDTILGMSGAEAEQQVLSQKTDDDMVAVAESILLSRLPPPDPRAILASHAVEAAAAALGPVSVAALEERTGIEERSLQRLFRDYVGVSPKWVIQRFRLQEATWMLAKPTRVDLSDMACQLGFFDQAHFTRDFTRLIGLSPLEYWKSQQTGAD
jgi:AraC-like DNA-binding protein